MNGHSLPGVPDLGSRGMTVRQWAVIPTPAVRVLKRPIGPMDGDYCLVVVDVLNQTGVLIPCSRVGLEGIRNNIDQLLAESE